eukprot:scaffold1546_cov121-Skeletonema_marinoi.AAC.2
MVLTTLLWGPHQVNYEAVATLIQPEQCNISFYTIVTNDNEPLQAVDWSTRSVRYDMVLECCRRPSQIGPHQVNYETWINQLLVKGNPSALRTFDNNFAIPLHVACQYHDLASVVQHLLSIDATVLDAGEGMGNRPSLRMPRSKA